MNLTEPESKRSTVTSAIPVPVCMASIRYPSARLCCLGFMGDEVTKWARSNPSITQSEKASSLSGAMRPSTLTRAFSSAYVCGGGATHPAKEAAQMIESDAFIVYVNI